MHHMTQFDFMFVPSPNMLYKKKNVSKSGQVCTLEPVFEFYFRVWQFVHMFISCTIKIKSCEEIIIELCF